MTRNPPVPYLRPSYRWVRWLTGSAVDVPEDLRAGLLSSYLTSMASLVSATVGNLVVNVIAAIRHPIPMFYTLLAIDLSLIVLRAGLLIALRRAASARTAGPIDLYIMTSVAWSCLLGATTYVCFTSGDTVLQVVAPVTTVAMVGGIATRNYGLPRLAILQMITMHLPYALGGALVWADPWMIVMVFQCPLYIVAMISTVFRLHRTYLTVAIAERENERRATHDALTGLCNRPGLMSALKRTLNRSGIDDEHFALFYLDLDGFKTINDVLGHAAGDRLLQLVASRLKTAMPPNGIVARLGGDEFVVLAPGVSRDQAEVIGATAIEVTSRPYDLGFDQPALIGVSVGLVCAGPDLSPDDLLARADAALYRAKAGGKGRLVVAAASAEMGPRRTQQRAA